MCHQPYIESTTILSDSATAYIETPPWSYCPVGLRVRVIFGRAKRAPHWVVKEIFHVI